MPNLVRTKDGKWRVTFIDNREVKHKTFDNVEGAADLMFTLGVGHDAIDDAIIAIYAYDGNSNTVAALFDSRGQFSHLDGI